MRGLICILFLGLLPAVASAATVYIDPASATLNRGDSITAAIRIDTNEQINECVNAVDIVLSYPDNITPVDISTGRSIVPIWVEAPAINKDTHTISLAGGIPNGYCGRISGDPSLTNVIADVIFRAPGLQIGSSENGNQANISFLPETTLYLNDGSGTKAETMTLGTTLSLSTTSGSRIVDQWRGQIQDDDIPPEIFSIALERDETTFRGNYYIVFNTTDKQTGLSHYEVIEEPIDQMNLFGFGAATAPWREARSPYELRDQSLNSAIRVKAVDKAGNEYIASLLPEEGLRTKSRSALIAQYGLLSLTGLLALLVAIIGWRYMRRRKRSESDQSINSENDPI